MGYGLWVVAAGPCYEFRVARCNQDKLKFEFHNPLSLSSACPPACPVEALAKSEARRAKGGHPSSNLCLPREAIRAERSHLSSGLFL